jgi:pimeloyl-ACP methyl ester carboxylesterase
MPDVPTIPRRRLLTDAARTAAAVSLALVPALDAAAREEPRGARAASAPAKAPGFAAIKQIDAGLLNVGYAEAGPAGGPAVVLLHGWPYDIHSYADVTARLARAGYRVIVPYLRGYGTTRVLSNQTFVNGQQSVFALDIIALMDALHIHQAIIGGFDWGSRTASILAALWPERCKAIVAVSGYLIVNVEANRTPLSPEAELGWWYQYYFATERGRAGYAANRHAFARLIWKQASPKWAFDDATFDRTARAFDNPDHVAIVIHNYRWRLGLEAGEPRCDEFERKLAQRPNVTVPAITIASDFDGAAASGAAYASKYTGPHVHRILSGIGHNVPQEDPEAFAAAVVEAARM